MKGTIEIQETRTGQALVEAPTAEGPEMWQKFRCDDCDSVWTEVYLLYLIEEA